MGALNKKRQARLKRKKRVRRTIFGTEERPRLTVFRSGRHMYAQIVVDVTGRTLVSVSTLHKEIRQQSPFEGKVGAAKYVGKLVAQRAMDKGVSKVVFDRNGFLYHGRIRAVATGAREQGLDF
ncbi:MAG: 50S ribosomal protein L18 [Deltaproteobacteria bacterium]|nr:50S ribosomal protein L18 [Deltaproteobacteria bacterium]MBW2601312.1 50S ribosomal protein L18 [Deltaproteobacteria bacterium]